MLHEKLHRSRLHSSATQPLCPCHQHKLVACLLGRPVCSVQVVTAAAGACPCRFHRLYPDSSIQVETLRREAVQASLLGVFAAHALLLAFSLKLKMTAALRQPDRSSRQPGNGVRAGTLVAMPCSSCGARATMLCASTNYAQLILHLTMQVQEGNG
jgi:hypothetical protein